MDAGLESVRAIIGNLETSGLSDATLKDVLWEYYFDIGRTIQWAIGNLFHQPPHCTTRSCSTDEQERRRRAEERKGEQCTLYILVSFPFAKKRSHDVPRPLSCRYGGALSPSISVFRFLMLIVTFRRRQGSASASARCGRNPNISSVSSALASVWRRTTTCSLDSSGTAAAAVDGGTTRSSRIHAGARCTGGRKYTVRLCAVSPCKTSSNPNHRGTDIQDEP